MAFVRQDDDRVVFFFLSWPSCDITADAISVQALLKQMGMVLGGVMRDEGMSWEANL